MQHRPVHSEIVRDRPDRLTASGLAIQDSSEGKLVHMEELGQFEVSQAQVLHPELQEIVPVQTGEASKYVI